jgi:hypothetical protein
MHKYVKQHGILDLYYNTFDRCSEVLLWPMYSRIHRLR